MDESNHKPDKTESTPAGPADLALPTAVGGQVLIYRDGALNLQVRMDGRTVWLTQAGMAELYQTSKQNISLHVRNILDEQELDADSVVKEYLTTAAGAKERGRNDRGPRNVELDQLGDMRGHGVGGRNNGAGRRAGMAGHPQVG